MAPPAQPPAARRSAPRARASGRSATASRSTRTSGPRRTTTGSTSGPGSRTSTRTAGFASIDPADLRGRLRWWGLYTQRKPGHRRRPHRGAGAARARRRVLHAPGPDRRRPARPPSSCGRSPTSPPSSAGTPPTSPTGRTSSCTGSGSRTCRRSGGGSRRSACRPPRRAATPRGSSSAARSPASRPTRCSTRRRRSTRSSERFVGDPEFSNLPRKFKSSISGSPLQDVAHEVNDISFVGVVHPEHGPGFDLWVGGGLSTNPMLAQRLGVWVPLRRGARRLGRRRRRLPRLRLPPAAHPGPAEVPGRRLGRGEVPRGAREGVPRPRRSSTARRPPCPTGRATTSACTSRRTAATTSGSRRRSAGSPAPLLAPVADLAEAHGCGRVRTTPYQKLLVLDVAADRVDSLVDAAGRPRPAGPAEHLPARHDGLHRHRVLQARDRRDQGPRRPSSSTSWSGGCPTSTSRSRSTSTAARTPAPGSRSPTSASRASWCPDADGNQVEGFQVHLGGGLGAGRRLRPQAARPQDHRRRAAGLRRAGRPRYVDERARRRAVRAVGRPGPTRRPCDERRRRARVRRSTARTAARRTSARTRTRTAPGSAAPAPACSPSSSSDW